MKKEYWIILIVYIAMQFSGILGIPLITFIGTYFGKDTQDMQMFAVSSWLVISFTFALIITLDLLRKEMKEAKMRDAASISQSVSWAIGGIFLAFFAQILAANIESLLGIDMGSENTQQIMQIIEASPIVILVSSIIGPILEEIVFRKIIFGTLHKKLHFFFAALISSLIFAIAHGEIEHLLLYSAMGFTFAFLYVKTKRIIVPIFAHVAMNTFVAVLQLNIENIENWLREIEKLQAFIGGF